MEEQTLGEWLKYEIELLRGKGLHGEKLKAELRRLVWLNKHKDLASSIGDARNMEEAWRICAECLEQELGVLTDAMSELLSASRGAKDVDGSE